MKRVIFLFLSFLFVMGFFSCKNNENAGTSTELDFSSFSVKRKSIKKLREVGKIAKVVELETTDESLVGEINKILVDKNGDFLIGDYYSRRQVFRFDKNGKFITSYGRQGPGPGEYSSIASFTVDSAGDVLVLAPLKLIRYNRDGKFLGEVRVDYSGNSIDAIGDQVFINILRYRSAVAEKTAFLILNKNLEKIGQILPYDTRLEKYLFMTRNAVASEGDNLYLTQRYDLLLTKYNVNSKQQVNLRIPNDNEQLERIWTKKGTLSEKDLKEIRDNVHRFHSVTCFDGKLFLSEFCREKKKFDFWLLDLDRKKTLILPREGMDKEISSLLGRVSCSYDKGVISYLDLYSPESLEHLKKDYPIFKDVTFSMEKNPYLVFIEFNEF